PKSNPKKATPKSNFPKTTPKATSKRTSKRPKNNFKTQLQKQLQHVRNYSASLTTTSWYESTTATLFPAAAHCLSRQKCKQLLSHHISPRSFLSTCIRPV